MRDLLITVPHASGFAPDEVLDEMLGPEARDPEARRALLHRLWLEGDPHTERLFALPGAPRIEAEVSRFVVDVNRGRAESGPNGVVKATDFSGRPLYPPGGEPGPERIEARLRRHYDPFHERVERALEDGSFLLLVDGHSMTPRGPAIGPDGAGRPRPAASLITGGSERGERTAGSVSLPPEAARRLAAALERALRAALGDVGADHPDIEAGVTLNRPFPTGEIQRRYGHPAHRARTPAVSIEWNRALFEGPDGEARPGRIEALRDALSAALEDARPELEAAKAERSGAHGRPGRA